jgi:hypothetical protein
MIEDHRLAKELDMPFEEFQEKIGVCSTIKRKL